MKLRKVIGMLIITLVATLAVCMALPTETYAVSVTLGITNIRESGEAYGIGGLKSDSTPEKKVWKIVEYEGSNKISYAESYYCIKAEHGFVSNTTSDVSTIRKSYDTTLDMKTESASVISKLNAINNVIGDTDLTQATYNKLMWIVDHMYVKNSSTASTDKANLLKNAGISNSKLTDDDIELVQQLALWYYTNPNDSTYNNSSITTIYSNNKTGKDSNYKALADWDDPLLNTKEGRYRQEQANILYKYFIENADASYDYSTKDKPAVNIEKNNPKAEQVGERFIVGPFHITADSTRDYDITNIEFYGKKSGGDSIQLSLGGENQLLDANKQVVSSGDIKSYIRTRFLSFNTNYK